MNYRVAPGRMVTINGRTLLAGEPVIGISEELAVQLADSKVLVSDQPKEQPKQESRK